MSPIIQCEEQVVSPVAKHGHKQAPANDFLLKGDPDQEIQHHRDLEAVVLSCMDTRAL